MSRRRLPAPVPVPVSRSATAAPCRRTALAAVLAVTALLWNLPDGVVPGGSISPATGATEIPASRSLGTRAPGPLFELNRGQAPERVRFISRTSDYTLYLERRGALIVPAGRGGVGDSGPGAVRMRLAGAAKAPRVQAMRQVPTVSNYFVGDDPGDWLSGIPNFRRVVYRGVYPGIDLLYRDGTSGLEFDFLVAPGADPDRIRMVFSGGGSPRLSPRGDLVVGTESGAVLHEKPSLFQRAGGRREAVMGSFRLHGKQVRFEVGPYDRSKPLVIDPVIDYASYIGGSMNERGHAVAIDGDGSAHITGVTSSGDFPVANSDRVYAGGKADIFVMKLNPEGSAIAYSTYLGGSGNDGGQNFGQIRGGITLDDQGDAYVTGATGSPNWPTTTGSLHTSPPGSAIDKGFVTKLDSAGALEYSTYLPSAGRGIAVDSTGAATLASGFKVVKLNAAGSALVYSANLTFQPDAVAVAGSSAYALGARVAQVTESGPGTTTTDYSPNLGGTGAAIALHGGRVYVTGQTFNGLTATMGAFQTAPAGGADAFLVKLCPPAACSSWIVEYASYLGGSGGDIGRGIGVDASGVAYVTGSTNSHDFPAEQSLASLAGGTDAFLTKLAPVAGAGPTLSTYLGGAERDNDEDGSIAVSPSGDAYLTGTTRSEDFPWVDPIQDQISGPLDAYIVKISPGAAPALTSISPRSGPTSGGTRVTIRGTRLEGVTGVRFGEESVPASDLSVISSEEIVAVSPPHPEGPVPIIVDASAGSSRSSYAGRFHYGQGAWEALPDLEMSRAGQTATLLDGPQCHRPETDPAPWCGRVLIAGGSPVEPINTPFTGGVLEPTTSVELFHPRTRTSSDSVCGATEVSPTCPSDLNLPRALHTATQLPDGKVLVTGGFSARDPDSGIFAGPVHRTNSAEIYDPATGRWTRVADMPIQLPPDDSRPEDFEWSIRENFGVLGHKAVYVPDEGAAHCGAFCGRVLVTGGAAGAGPYEDSYNQVMLYDPAADRWTPGPPMRNGRFFHGLVLLPREHRLCAGDSCVEILAIGGYDNPDAGLSDVLGQSERFLLPSGQWAPMQDWQIDRYFSSATLLGSGNLLVAGGIRDYINGNTLKSVVPDAEIYDPRADSWRPTGALARARFGHAAALLPAGEVLVAGGTGIGPLNTAELFEPGAAQGQGRWRSAGAMLLTRTSQDVYSGLSSSAGYGFTATLLSSSATGFEADPRICGDACGRVLVVGGSTDLRPELYTPRPSVDSVAPPSGPVEGGTAVQMTGTGFTHELKEVRFGDASVPCPSEACRIDSFSRISVIAPAAAEPGAVDISVTTTGGRATSRERFTYAAGGAGSGGGGNQGGGLPRTVVDDLTATATSDSTIELNFSAPLMSSGASAPAADYIVKQSKAPLTDASDFDRAGTLCGGSCRIDPAAAGDKVTLTVRNLDPGTTYHYALRPRDESGEPGPISNPASARTLDDTIRPGRVRNLRARAISSKKIKLTFSAPGSNGISPPPAGIYVIKQSSRPIINKRRFRSAKTLCGGTCLFSPLRVGDELKLTVSNLKPGKKYFYALKAVDLAGNQSSRSNPAKARTRGRKPRR